ncbi:MAG: alpha/beta hydrolase [Solirubrobacteraceae bacterium]
MGPPHRPCRACWTGCWRWCWSFLPGQLADWQAAVAHARGLENIDPDRVGAWGMSMGGGHALLTAARNNRIAAVVALVPSTDPLAAQPPLRIGLRMIARGVRETIVRHPVRMPTAGPPGSFAIIAAPEALPGFQRLTASGDWSNDANTSWLLAARRWRPVSDAANIQAPVLLQLGERDGCVPRCLSGQERRSGVDRPHWLQKLPASLVLDAAGGGHGSQAGCDAYELAAGEVV